MAVNFEYGQRRLQYLSDQNGREGIPCRVCNQKIIPPDHIGDHKVDGADTYHYFNNGGHEFFIHKKCLRKEVQS